MPFSRRIMRSLTAFFKNLGSFRSNEREVGKDDKEDLQQASGTFCSESCFSSGEFGSEAMTVATIGSSAKKALEGSLLSDLHPALKRHVASYLSPKDAFRLRKTSKTFHSELNLRAYALSETFLLRKLFWTSLNEDYRFVQKLPSTFSNKEDSNLHSVHVHCRLTPEWDIFATQIPKVELLVVERDTSRTTAAVRQFETDRVIARGTNRLDDDSEGRLQLGVSFTPKRSTTTSSEDQSPYELWVRWSSVAPCVIGPGYGEVVALGIFCESQA